MRNSVSPEKLKTCRICNGLKTAEVAKLATFCSARILNPGEAVDVWQGSGFFLYTILSGRLRILHREPANRSGDQLHGYANQGETVGQTALISERLADETRFVADIESEVAVISRSAILRMMLELPRLRENFWEMFGVRIDSLVSGKPLRRTPRVVGIVRDPRQDNRRSVALIIAAELKGWGDEVAVMTDQVERFDSTMGEGVHVLPFNSSQVDVFAGQIREQLSGVSRVLIDFDACQATDQLLGILGLCDEIMWCYGDDDDEHRSMLDKLLKDDPALATKVVGIQVLGPQESLGRTTPCCSGLKRRDFVLSISSISTEHTRIQQQGLDRIVRHLFGVKVGIALGGGGARGLAHLGVLRSLDRSGFSFDMMSGTSAGAMIGVGYAAGLNPDYLIETFARELQPPGLLERIPYGRRLFLFAKFRAKAWEQMLRKHYQHWTLEQLPIPFSIVSTDLVSGEEVVTEKGDIVRTILESINVPVLAPPILRDGKVLVDGGVINNLPAQLLSDRGAQYVIGVDVSKEIPLGIGGNHAKMKTREMKKPSGIETAYRIMEVSRRGVTQLQMSFADQVIEPDTSAFDFADFTQAAGIAETGERATEERLPDIWAAYKDLMRRTRQTEDN